MTDTKISFGGIGWETPHPGLRQKRVESDGIAHRLVEITGEFVEDGWCVKAHHGYVIDGTLFVETDSGKTAFRHGDGIAIPAGLPHKASAAEGSRALFFLADPIG